MSYDFPAVSVYYCCQIHMPMGHGDVGDIDGPNLIGEVYIVVTKQIRHDGLLGVALEKVDFRIDSLYSHLIHQATDDLARNRRILIAELLSKLARAKIWIVRMPPVDALHDALLALLLNWIRRNV